MITPNLATHFLAHLGHFPCEAWLLDQLLEWVNLRIEGFHQISYKIQQNVTCFASFVVKHCMPSVSTRQLLSKLVRAFFHVPHQTCQYGFYCRISLKTNLDNKPGNISLNHWSYQENSMYNRCWSYIKQVGGSLFTLTCLSVYISILLSVEVYLSISPIQSCLPRRIQVSPEKGISPAILFWGWDWDHQSYSREGSGFLGYHLFIYDDVHNVSQRCTNLLKSTVIFPQNASDSQLSWWGPHVNPELRYFEHLLQCIEVVNVSPVGSIHRSTSWGTEKTWGAWIFPCESWLVSRDPGILIMV